ncbi:hypothetical protein V8C35DRAFT_305165 [Trichoderma chlorosporum]
MHPDAIEDRMFQIPPLEIKFANLNISPKDRYCKNAIKALENYWAQATVMTKDEQLEYWDLLVTQKLYVWRRSDSPSSHRLYRQILRERGSWPEWVLLTSLYDFESLKDPEMVIELQFGTSAIEDHTREYQIYFPTEVPDLDDNVEYEGDEPLNGETHLTTETLVDEDEELDVKGQDLDQNNETNNDSGAIERDQKGNQERDTPSKEDTIEQPETPINGKAAARVRDALVELPDQSTALAKRPANSNLGKDSPEKRRRMNNTQTLEELLEEVANKAATKAAQLVAAEMGRKFDGVLDAVKVWSEETAVLIGALNKSTERLVGVMAEYHK